MQARWLARHETKPGAMAGLCTGLTTLLSLVRELDRYSGAGRVGATRLIPAVLVDAAEDHFAAGSLQNAGHRDLHIAADHSARVVDDHHGAVIEIADALV